MQVYEKRALPKHDSGYSNQGRLGALRWRGHELKSAVLL